MNLTQRNINFVSNEEAGGFGSTTNEDNLILTERRILNLEAYELFMQAPVGFFLVTGDDHIVTLANKAGLELMGRTKEIINKPIREVFTEIDSQGHLLILNSVKNTGKPYYLNENKVEVLKNGIRETLFLNIIYQPYFENKIPNGILAIITDVTEQLLARKVVEEAEQKARIAIESAYLGVYEIDLQTKLIKGDKRFFYLFGFDREVEWEELTRLIPLEDLKIRDEAYEEAYVTGKLFYITRILCNDKSIRWLKINGSIFFDQEKKPIKLLGVVEDISKQKELDRQKDAFISMASHELKTPVTTMKAYGQIAEGILKEKGDFETLSMIEKMSSQVNKLTRIINDLLDITRIEQDKLIYNLGSFDFNTLVNEAIDDMQKITTTHTIQKNLCASRKIITDKDKFSQVINNLLSNAIKYSPNAHLVIVESYIINDGIELQVKDFGIGISALDQSHIFEQFYRVSGENQSTFPGMGIGLFICSQIIKKQGGKISVESKSNEGSVFKIWLPIK